MGYIVAWILSLLGVQVHIDGDCNIWYLLFVVAGVSWYASSLVRCNSDCSGAWLFVFIFLFLTGSYSLFKSADLWRIGTC